MDERQKEMLKNRALLEFYRDYPDIKPEDIDDVRLIKRIRGPKPKRHEIRLSHHILAVKLKDDNFIAYIPSDRFRVEDNDDRD